MRRAVLSAAVLAVTGGQHRGHRGARDAERRAAQGGGGTDRGRRDSSTFRVPRCATESLEWEDALL